MAKTIVEQTLTPRAPRANGRYNSNSIPVPAGKTATVRLTLDASTMTENHKVKVGIEMSSDGGATWARLGSVSAQGNVPAGGTKGDPQHPWIEFDVTTTEKSTVRGFMEVAGGPFAFGVDLKAEWL